MTTQAEALKSAEPATVRELIARLRQGDADAQIAADLLETRAPVSDAQPIDGLRDAVWHFLRSLDEYPEQLVPVNRKSVMVRELRALTDAAPDVRPSVPVSGEQIQPRDGWAVHVEVDGERILSIESECLSGVHDIDRYADTVRNCAQHLLSFIGNGEPSEFFPPDDAPVASQPAAPQQEPANEDLADAVSKAMRRAFSLGQTYWQQADSESYAQNRKSDDTHRKFENLAEETRAAVLAASHPQEAGVGAEDLLRSVYTRPDLTEQGRELFVREFMQGGIELTLTWGDFRTMAAAARAAQAAPSVPEEWRCFHCGESFTDAEQAALHFGPTQRHEPGCQVSVEQMRELERDLERYREEDTDLHRQIYGMQAQHHTALQREEEKGYARGLRDAAAPSVSADAKDAGGQA